MAAGREVVLRITANVTSLRAGMLSAAATVKTFEGQVLQVAKTSSETQRIAGRAMLGIGVAAAAGLALAVRSAVQFEQRMRNVATISGDVEKNFGAAGDAVLEMSGRLGIGANELAEGLYDVASSGFQGAAGMQILETAAIAAQAGLSTTAVAARAITGALNAYGLSVSQAGDVSDIFFQTVNLGIVTFDELAQNVGDFMGTANVLGVSLDKASASFATITLAGVPAAEAATSLNAVMTQMLSPSIALTSTMQALGYESGQAMVEALGLHGTLQLLRDSTGDNTAAFAALFPEIRAMRGAIALTAQDGATYNRVAGEITDKSKRAGAAAEALAIQQKSLGGQLKIAKEQIQALAIGVGQKLLPVLRPVVTVVQNVAAGFAALGGGAQTGVAAIGVLSVGVLTLGGGFLLLAPKIYSAITAFRLMAVTMPLLAASIQTVMIALGVVGAALLIAGGILAVYGEEKRKVKASTDLFVDALKAEKAGIEGSVNAAIAKKIADEGLAKIATGLGLSLDTVVRAMKGEKDALAEVDAVMERGIVHHELQDKGYFKLRESVGLSAKGLDKATETMRLNDEAAQGVAESTGEVVAGHEDLAGAAAEATDAQKALLSSLQAMVDLSAIYVDGQRAVEDAEKDANKVQADRIRDGAKATADAMGARHKAERDALDAETVTGKASQKAHDQRVKDLDKRQEKEKEASDTTVESEGERATAIENANTRAVISLQSYMKLISDAGKARLNRQRNLAVISARGAPEDVVAELAELPEEYAGVIEEIARSSPAAFAEFMKTAAAGSKDAVAAAQAEFDLLPPAIKTIGALAGEGFAADFLEKVRLGLVPVSAVIAEATRLRTEKSKDDAVMIPTGAPGEYRPRGGGVVANVDMRAEGHFAQIAPAGAWRVWAEPETGGESYIPHAFSKRTRSLAILAQTAAAFGHTVTPMAAGGTWGVPAYTADRSAAAAGMNAADTRRLISALEKNAKLRPAQMQNVFPPGIDPVHVAQKIAWRLRP